MFAEEKFELEEGEVFGEVDAESSALTAPTGLQSPSPSRPAREDRSAAPDAAAWGDVDHLSESDDGIPLDSDGENEHAGRARSRAVSTSASDEEASPAPGGDRPGSSAPRAMGVPRSLPRRAAPGFGAGEDDDAVEEEESVAGIGRLDLRGGAEAFAPSSFRAGGGSDAFAPSSFRAGGGASSFRAVPRSVSTEAALRRTGDLGGSGSGRYAGAGPLGGSNLNPSAAPPLPHAQSDLAARADAAEGLGTQLRGLGLARRSAQPGLGGRPGSGSGSGSGSGHYPSAVGFGAPQSQLSRGAGSGGSGGSGFGAGGLAASRRPTPFGGAPLATSSSDVPLASSVPIGIPSALSRRLSGPAYALAAAAAEADGARRGGAAEFASSLASGAAEGPASRMSGFLPPHLMSEQEEDEEGPLAVSRASLSSSRRDWRTRRAAVMRSTGFLEPDAAGDLPATVVAASVPRGGLAVGFTPSAPLPAPGLATVREAGDSRPSSLKASSLTAMLGSS